MYKPTRSSQEHKPTDIAHRSNTGAGHRSNTIKSKANNVRFISSICGLLGGIFSTLFVVTLFHFAETFIKPIPIEMYMVLLVTFFLVGALLGLSSIKADIAKDASSLYYNLYLDLSLCMEALANGELDRAQSRVDMLRENAYGHGHYHGDIKEAVERATNAVMTACDISDYHIRRNNELTLALQQRIALLNESETHLNYALRSARMGIWNIDYAVGTVSWSEDYNDILGLDHNIPNTWPLEDFLAIVHPDDREKLAKILKPDQDEIINYETEYRIVHSDGRISIHSSTGYCINDETGTPLKATGIVIDVTKQKELMEELAQKSVELEQQKAFLRTVIDTSPSLIFVKDRSGAFVLVNKSLAEVYGSSIDDLVGKRDSDFNSNTEEVEHFLRCDRNVMDTLTRIEVEEMITDAHGQTRWLQTVKCPFMQSGDKADHVLGIATDISRLKHLQAQMVHAEKLAALGQLIAGIAHEINNPLAAIYGNAQLMVTQDNLEYKEEVDVILRMAERTQRIIKSLLTFTRGQAEERMVCAPNDIISNTIILCQGKLYKEHIALDIELSQNLPNVLVDSNQIEQVMVNLVNNAVHALQKNDLYQRKIKISSGTENGCVIISVSDNGSGIPEEIRYRIFDPFFTTKQVGEGTGLGLSICQGLIESHGGKISFTSEVGVGSTFTITLPVPNVD